MDREVDRARDVADEVLSRISIDGGPSWTVLDVIRSEEVASPPTEEDGVFHLRISLGEGPGEVEAAAVYFTVGVHHEDAVAATANQIQDHAIEATHGTALPVCPGHHHPLQAVVRNGIAQWICPKDPSHHSEPILGTGDR
jgi:hypothetical protein